MNDSMGKFIIIALLFGVACFFIGKIVSDRKHEREMADMVANARHDTVWIPGSNTPVSHDTTHGVSDATDNGSSSVAIPPANGAGYSDSLLAVIDALSDTAKTVIKTGNGVMDLAYVPPVRKFIWDYVAEKYPPDTVLIRTTETAPGLEVAKFPSVWLELTAGAMSGSLAPGAKLWLGNFGFGVKKWFGEVDTYEYTASFGFKLF